MALNTLKCNRLMPLPFKGLMRGGIMTGNESSTSVDLSPLILRIMVSIYREFVIPAMTTISLQLSQL